MRVVLAFLIVFLFGFIPSYAENTALKQTNDANIRNGVDWNPYITELEKKDRKSVV